MLKSRIVFAILALAVLSVGVTFGGSMSTTYAKDVALAAVKDSKVVMVAKPHPPVAVAKK